MADISTEANRLATYTTLLKKDQELLKSSQSKLILKQTELRDVQIALGDTTAVKAEIALIETQIAAIQARINSSTSIIASAQAGLSSISYTGKNLGNKNANDNPTSTKPYKYNPPLVQTATLNERGPQFNTDVLGSKTKFNNSTEVKQYWKGEKLGKGTIQQSKKFPYSFDSSTATKLASASNTLFGFRFLYNPTEVFMNWGASSEIDIAKFVNGETMLNPVTDAASASSINFSIILNRIPDMSIVNSDGTLTVQKAYSSSSGNISAVDAKGIYEKGTMYDLEYLFRACNGFNVEFVSSLGISSADPGWINSFPVELHLGNTLRYLIRVTNLEVNHKIFDYRMVPTFTVVNLVCKRLPDWDTAYKAAGIQSNQGGFR